MNPEPATRLSLIARLVDLENEDAWNEFVLIYQPVIQRFLTKYGLQYADAAEVTQEVLSGVVKSIDSWDGSNQTSSFRGWLYRITRNKAVNLIREKTREAAINLNSNLNLGQIAQANIENAESEFLGEFERQTFLWAAETIKPSIKPVNWQAFWRSTIDGQSIEQVAKDLNIDSSAVYVARCRIMKRLTELVQKKLNESLSD